MITDIRILENNRFSVECYTDFGDTIWIGYNEEDYNTDKDFYLCSAREGYIYSDASLTTVIKYFLQNYHVHSKVINTLLDYVTSF